MNVAEKLADYCRRSMNAEPRWHYRQYRPMRLGVSPDVEQDGDCSGHATQAYYWAGCPDPNHCGYDGSGYTGTLQHNPKVTGSYQVGDLAIYGTSTGNTTHVCTCYQAGSSSSARWTSHGSEAGPYSCLLYYRSDLLFVVRPGLGDGTGGGDEVNVPDWYWPWADWYLNTGSDKNERPESGAREDPRVGLDIPRGARPDRPQPRHDRAGAGLDRLVPRPARKGSGRRCRTRSLSSGGTTPSS